ncbi:hypothetical protein BBP40_012647 [Aspergillus hancockii]|nr:hypothetical protein BBP40_012647 [Aspergillus hancockii]
METRRGHIDLNYNSVHPSGVLSPLPWSDHSYQNLAPSGDYATSIPINTQNVLVEDCLLNEDVTFPEVGFLHDGSSGSYDHAQNTEARNTVDLQTPQFLNGYDGWLQQSHSVSSTPNLGLGEREEQQPSPSPVNWKISINACIISSRQWHGSNAEMARESSGNRTSIFVGYSECLGEDTRSRTE